MTGLPESLTYEDEKKAAEAQRASDQALYDVMLEALKGRESTLLDALVGMVQQHCCQDMMSELDSSALSDNAYAMRVLAEFGRLHIDREYGKRVIGHWPRGGGA